MLVYVWFAVYFYITHVYANESVCPSTQDDKSICMPVTECQPMTPLLTQKPLSASTIIRLKSLHCGFNGGTPKICCPITKEISVVNTVSTTASTTTATAAQAPSPEKHSEAPHNLLPNFETCGLFAEDRIYSGQNTEIGAFPWSALLQYETPNGNEFHCGGALINKRYVLTAARCVSNKDIPKDWKLTSVRLGEHSLSTTEDCVDFGFEKICADPVIDVPLEEIVIHNEYNSPDENHSNDVALIRLAKEIDYSDWITPLCLPPLSKLNVEDNLSKFPLIVTGWGSTFNTTNTINIKQEIVYDLKDSQEYEAWNKNKTTMLRKDQLCGKTRSSETSCHADRGAVVMSIRPEYSYHGNHFAIGILSVESDNCSKGQEYVVFMRLKDYIEWIVDNIKA